MFKNKYFKYKNKYLDLKQQKGGAGGGGSMSSSTRYDISLPLHQKCDKCFLEKSCPHTHQEFTLECTPYTDVTVGKYNIVNWNNNYIYYNRDNEANTIRMTKSFNFIDIKPLEPERFSRIELEQFITTEIAKFNKPISNTYLDNYINYEIEIRGPYILPLYFMYVNVNNNIFNLFCYSCTSSEIDNLQISYDSNLGKFVKFKSRFNIFSVSLLCNKFFDIIPLFLNPSLNIINELTEMFKDFAIEKLYYQSIYKENYNLVKKKSEYLNYRFDIIDRTKTIQKLSNQIEIYKRKFSILNKIIPEFDKIYIMSLLYHRLVRATNINSSWNFDTYYIHQVITSSRINGKPKKYFDIYLDDALVLYDNNEEISFRNEKYRCCMENTLLQFLKVLFWDTNTKTYNLTNIREIIKIELQEKIHNFFTTINDELTQKFISNWTIFVTELSNEYNFVKRENNVELFPDINNFILFLRNIIKSEYHDTDSEVFLSNIIQKINNDYIIYYDIKNFETVINIVTYKEFKIILTHKHAYFEHSKMNSYNINILTKIKKSERQLSNYLYTNLSFCLVDINSFIIFLSLSSAENPEKIIINKYLKNINNKQYIYFNFFHDNIIPNINDEILLLLLNNQDVYSTFDIQEENGDIMWHYITGSNITSENFWNKVIDEGLCISWDNQGREGNTVWHIAIREIRSESFWNKVIDKGLCTSWDRPNNNGNNVWHIAIHKKMSESFWNKVIDKDLCTSWNILDNKGRTIWQTSVQNIKSENFWNKVIEKDLYTSWDILDINGRNVWFYIGSNITFESFWEQVINKLWKNQHNNDTKWNSTFRNITSEIFWIQVIDRGLCESWNNNIWHNAIMYIKSKLFWNKVIDRGLCESWGNNIWHNATSIITSELFWNKVIDRGLGESWNNNIWHNAVMYIKSESFWIQVINNGLCSSWNIPNKDGNNVWHIANRYIKLERFWNQVIIEKGLCTSWEKPNNEGDTVWHIATRNISSESFWNQVIIRNLYVSWDRPNKNNDTVWHIATDKITSESFWNNVIDKGLCTSWDNYNYQGDTIWHIAVQNIKSESFWNKVIKKDLYKSWDNKNSSDESVWYLARSNIISESFWKKVSEK